MKKIKTIEKAILSMFDNDEVMANAFIEYCYEREVDAFGSFLDELEKASVCHKAIAMEVSKILADPDNKGKVICIDIKNLHYYVKPTTPNFLDVPGMPLGDDVSDLRFASHYYLWNYYLDTYLLPEIKNVVDQNNAGIIEIDKNAGRIFIAD